MRHIRVDKGAGVFVAKCKNGLVLEDESLERLMERMKIAEEELEELNGTEEE